MSQRRAVFKMLLALLVAGLGNLPNSVSKAADHRDSPVVDGAGEGDIGDVYAFLDPNNSSRLVLIMGVNPFAVPSVRGTYRFSENFLYQFKVDNTGDAREDIAIQVKFDNPATGAQMIRVWVTKPDASNVGNRNSLATGTPTVQGEVETMLGDASGVQVFAGLREEPFVADIGQVNRILAGKQDVFRAVTSPVAAVGSLRGRAVRADGTSGFDGFGGFNGSFIAISLPASMVRPASGSRINVWGTVSFFFVQDNTWLQFERMGQPLFNTVFVPAGMKDMVNFTIPSEDMMRYSNLIPDALTDTDTTGNTIEGRATVLNAVGVTSMPAGAPLLLPATFKNSNKDLLRVALLPDVLRLDLDLPPNELGIGQFGLTNGRRPGDAVVDIALRVLRQLADVNFPSALGVPGSGAARPGALNFPADRRVLLVLQGTQFIKPDSATGNLADSGNQKPLPTTFPFLAAPEDFPGEADTTGFPAKP